MPFYAEYFSKVKYRAAIKTRDIDFLVPSPSNVRRRTDIPELLKDLGFVVGFKGTKGYIKLEHPELVVEFLVPEKGKGDDGPYPLPQLGLNAQTLRMLSFLVKGTINVTVEGLSLKLPHPANFALHKLIIYQRRANAEKAMKDKDAAVEILKALIAKGELGVLRGVFNDAPATWRKKILEGLEKAGEEEIALTLQTRK
jgi:hypothetical protein